MEEMAISTVATDDCSRSLESRVEGHFLTCNDLLAARSRKEQSKGFRSRVKLHVFMPGLHTTIIFPSFEYKSTQVFPCSRALALAKTSIPSSFRPHQHLSCTSKRSFLGPFRLSRLAAANPSLSSSSSSSSQAPPPPRPPAPLRHQPLFGT